MLKQLIPSIKGSVLSKREYIPAFKGLYWFQSSIRLLE